MSDKKPFTEEDLIRGHRKGAIKGFTDQLDEFQSRECKVTVEVDGKRWFRLQYGKAGGVISGHSTQEKRLIRKLLLRALECSV